MAASRPGSWSFAPNLSDICEREHEFQFPMPLPISTNKAKKKKTFTNFDLKPRRVIAEAESASIRSVSKFCIDLDVRKKFQLFQKIFFRSIQKYFVRFWGIFENRTKFPNFFKVFYV